MKHPDAAAHTSFSRPFRFRSFFVCLVVLLLAVFTLLQTGGRVIKADSSRINPNWGSELGSDLLAPNDESGRQVDVSINGGQVRARDAGLDTLRIDAGTFVITGSLNFPRSEHTATLLPNGKVLAAGGYNNSSQYLTSAELYDPTTGSWTATGSLTIARYDHTATLLQNGKVLVVGGVNSSSTKLASAELYDPTSSTWTATGNLFSGRCLHTATLLQNGKVLVAGGISVYETAELYDPASGTWTNTGGYSVSVPGRNHHTATLLPNGKVLVAGGGQPKRFNQRASV